jgi:predicted metalloprotease
MFTVAVGASSGLTNDNLANLQDVMYNLGDDVLTGKANYDGDHGLGKNRKKWFTTGQQNSLIGKCNTYTAPETAVR